MFARGILYVAVFVLEVAIFAGFRSAKVRQAALLAGSCVLYLSWGYWFGAVLLVSIVMNYLLGSWVRRRPTGSVLAIGILFNLALLTTFKYLPGVAINFPVPTLQRFAHLALPLGISFWTFQAMSYLFDLYRGEELDPSLSEFALFMAFFPVTISGPICRMTEMLEQFRSERPLAWSAIKSGVGRIATGVLMMQLARLLGQGILGGGGIDSGFDSLTHWSGSDVWCLAFGYGLQLFFDFAGYCHIAIGAAQVLGFTVPENFARPFQSTSPSIFWTRWHMSLSFWIRDYVFLPLAMLRREVWWRNLILVVSMVLFGLWHNASLLFLIWGCYHGVLLVVHRLVQQAQRRFDWNPPPALWTPLAWITTISLVSLGWIFFRAHSVSQARQMLAAVFSPASYLSHSLSASLYLLVLALAVGYVTVLLVSEALNRYLDRSQAGPGNLPAEVMLVLARKRWLWIAPLYATALLIALTVTLTQVRATSQFMYRGF
ncbi:MAG: MBOAT family O-acyltransferase [Candidatus Korobacteraceae bacterium]